MVNKPEESRYKEGQIVFAKKFPIVKFKVRRHYQRVYYCSFIDFPERKDLVFFEREILAAS